MAPPPVTDQVTAELKLPVPWTLAVHCEVAPVAIVEGEQLGATEEMAGELAGGDVADEPPQETRPQRATHEKTRQPSEGQEKRVFKEVPRLLLRHAWGGYCCPERTGKR
jgi:hypothetical protein